ncbi:hypothetical protein GGR56DRAFT_654355 [Xylariaceae sp. FL0804]|nr:hypothetical protein GGR56DRAFT_654355 [Xylariaceae sp. FL0804]
MPSQPCQTCGLSNGKTYTCIQCNNLAFCEECWPKWVLHLPGSVGWNGKPHEKADPAVVHRLRQILEPTRTETEHESQLREDYDTTWFGFSRDDSGHPLLHDYGRFAAIMGETMADEPDVERYPQLASFIGETGAGKSTLIKLLIDSQDLDSPEGSRYFSPVTSSNQDRISTTGDVHLYADPASLHSSNPLLLVDCEGFSGGEAVPKQLRQHRDDADSARPNGDHAGRYSSTRKIEWAETPQTQKREFAVSQLYPRILYTFSDVVVFVLRNPRAFESTVLNKLIQWGAASIDKSINQPVLPHAIIVLNATDININEDEWDVSNATQLLMSDIKGAIFREPELQEHVKTWRTRGRDLQTTEELLECYYASVNVVRVPYKGSYMLMDQQARKLSNLVKDRCAASQAKKKQMRMLATAEKMQFYLSAAYDHFSRDLNTPFDFVKESLRHTPISRNFEGNILSLALAIKNGAPEAHVRDDAEEIFRAMGPMIASCVMLDAVRQKLPGAVSHLLNDMYATSCTGAMQAFGDVYWPCSFFNPSMDPGLGQCCNVKSGHNRKGHQNKQGKIIGHGGYQSSFDVMAFQPVWEHLIRESLIQGQSASFRLSHEFPELTELQVAALLHQERLNQLFSNVLGCATDFVSYSACLCCLRELPECALPCGHNLCLSCVEIYGERTSRTTIEISRCPLHISDVIASPPWVIPTKPAYAGARVLCLDGGGIRGVVQLQVLNEIERMLGPNLPIQLFFDLIVGASSGGLISIALGVKKWTVAATLEHFKEICRDAFASREMPNIPLLGQLSSLFLGSLYKTQPMEQTLKSHFAEQPFYGGATHRSRLTTSNKVAVTARSVLNRQNVVFANYNRPDPFLSRVPYHFTRADVPAKEIKIWEAARATLATSPMFKPFTKPETQMQYISSDLQDMCPVSIAHHESKAIWTDVAGSPPDLLLSIGAGRNIGDKFDDDRASALAPRPATSSSSIFATMPRASAVLRPGRGGTGYFQRSHPFAPLDDSSLGEATRGYDARGPQSPMMATFNQAFSGPTARMSDQRQCERTWSQFVTAGGGVGGGGEEVGDDDDDDGQPARAARARQRYMRVSPELFSKLPRFDEVQKMEAVEGEARDWLRRNSHEMVEIAHRLVASTFFFDKDVGSVRQTESGYTCTGTIHCRFRPKSPEIEALAWLLIGLLVADFEPYFVVEIGIGGIGGEAVATMREIPLTAEILREMHDRARFRLGPVRVGPVPDAASEVGISLCLWPHPYPSGAAALPISGFPRRLMAEDEGMVQNAAVNSQLHSSIEKRTSATDSSSGGSAADSASVQSPTSPIHRLHSRASSLRLSIWPSFGGGGREGQHDTKIVSPSPAGDTTFPHEREG